MAAAASIPASVQSHNESDSVQAASCGSSLDARSVAASSLPHAVSHAPPQQHATASTFVEQQQPQPSAAASAPHQVSNASTLPPPPLLPPPPRAYASSSHQQLQAQSTSVPATSASSAEALPLKEQIHPAFFYPSDPEQSDMIYYSPGYAVATAPNSDAAPLPPLSECKVQLDFVVADEVPGIPVFHPTTAQFGDFEMFCAKIDAWGMRSGVVKVVPPPSWNAELPKLYDAQAVQTAIEHGESVTATLAAQPISSVRIRNAISQKWVSAGPGLWRQQNILHSARQWNTLQWAQTCASEAQRGPTMERMRANARFNVRERAATNVAAGRKRNKPTTEEMKELEAEGIRTRSGRARDTKPVLPSASAIAQAAAKKRKREAAAAAAAAAPPTRLTDSTKTSSTNTSPPSTEPTTTSTPPSHDVPCTSDAKQDEDSAVVTSDMPPPLEDAPATASTTMQRSPTKLKPCDLTTPQEWAAFDYAAGWVREALQLHDEEEENKKEHASLSQQKQQGGSAENDESPKPDSHDVAMQDKHQEETERQKSNDTKALTPNDWRDPLVCREFEGEYWRNLNFGKSPMYGADLKGTLFTDATQTWNVGHLPNILTRLHVRGKKGLPGVTTPYLYFGMWRATFAWHVEDMDLYSINYIHCGAPKQWYAIRQADNKRFEQTMLSAFPSDSAKCKHFLRHKQYLASPAFLASHNIQPLRMVHHAGEFVITYPYGYHSGFNMGFNVAESVNFALPAWLEFGRRAGWCNCEEDSVHMDVDALIKESDEKLQLERMAEEKAAERAALKAKSKEGATPGALTQASAVPLDPVREARRQAARERDRLRRLRKKQEKLALLAAEGGADAPTSAAGESVLPHPDNGSKPASAAPTSNGAPAELQEPAAKRHKSTSSSSRSGSSEASSDEDDDRFCCFCVSPMNDDLVPIPNEQQQPPSHAHTHDVHAQGQAQSEAASSTATVNGHAAGATGKSTQRFAHRFCANFVPETWVQPGEERADGLDSVVGFENIEKARWALKCTLCPTPAFARQGVKVQCTYGTCVKAAHVGCAVLETTGWLLEVLPGAEADELEGRNKPKLKPKTGKGRSRKSGAGKKKDAVELPSSQAPQPESSANSDMQAKHAAVQETHDKPLLSVDDARHVVLCAAHNPHKPKTLSPEAARREAVMRTCVLALKPGELVEIRQGGSAWNAPLVSFTDSNASTAPGSVPGSVCVLQNGVERTVKWKYLIFEPEAVAQAEAAYDAARAKETSTMPKPVYAPQAVAQVEAAAAEAARKQAAQKRKHNKTLADGEGTPGATSDPSVIQNASLSEHDQQQPALKKPRKSNKPDMPASQHAWPSHTGPVKPLQLLNPPLSAPSNMGSQSMQQLHHAQQQQQPSYARTGMSHMYGQGGSEHHAHSLSHLHAQQQQQQQLAAQHYARYLSPQHSAQRGYPDNMAHFMQQQPRSAPSSHPFQPPGLEHWHHGAAQSHWSPAPLQHQQQQQQQQHGGYGGLASLNYAFRPPTDATPPSLPAMRERPEDERSLHQLHAHATHARAGGVRSSPYYVAPHSGGSSETQAGQPNSMPTYLPPMYGSSGSAHSIGAPYASSHGSYSGLPLLGINAGSSAASSSYGSANGASPLFRSQLPLPSQQQQQQQYAMHSSQQQQQQQPSPHAQYAHSSYSQSPMQSPLPPQAQPQGHGHGQNHAQRPPPHAQPAQHQHQQGQQQSQQQVQQVQSQTPPQPITSTPSLRGGA